MKHMVMIGVVLLMIFGAYVTTSAQKSDQGKTLYETNCAECHGETGKGDGPAGMALGSKPPDFTKPKFWQGNMEKKIETAVTDGYGTMPPLDLHPEEVKAIIGYLSHSFKK